MEIGFLSTSMITHTDLQRVEVDYRTERVYHLLVSLIHKGETVQRDIPLHLDSGKGKTCIFIRPFDEDKALTVRLYDNRGEEVYSTQFDYKKPLERTIYTMISSHTDIGLHNSQYIQRSNCSRFIDMATELMDHTAERDPMDRYRYTVEGTWFWNNYGADRGRDAAEAVIEKYVNSKDMGVCAGIAGNHTQAFGLEEMCRCAYEKRRLYEKWNISSETMAMIDINGMSMSLIGPCTEAGYKNIIFSPNQWNPLPSTVWKTDTAKNVYNCNCDAGGGGSRIDIRYDSEMPMVFFWENSNKSRLLVFGVPTYSQGCAAFGFYPYKGMSKPLCDIEDAMARQLAILDRRYPYEVWLNVCYNDDQEPDMEITDKFKEWNGKWKWPKLRTLGAPDELFDILREKYSEVIPVLKGDITGGWYQHPIAAPELLAEKYTADRSLPNAEKWSVVASLLDSGYEYPAQEIRRAWDHLLFNDEHSYGTSGYQGRRVYETWMQHRDWIEKAQRTADTESSRALESIAKSIASDGEGYIVFNPTLLERNELIEQKEGYALVSVPPLGYCRISKNELKPYKESITEHQSPPIAENGYYRVTFSENGSIQSIFDKELGRELIDKGSDYRANEFIYTKDNHKSFLTPGTAAFKVEKTETKTVITVETFEEGLGADIRQIITLPCFEKRIDIDNRILSARDMINTDRYHRFLYSAFPFAVENARRFCHLNGVVAEYGKDVTGHCTDVYMAANEWCCCENDEYGVGLIMQDSSLVEFGNIHPDKTDFGNLKEGSQMFVYLANDWLQMHCVGGSHVNYRFRYTVTSYKGNYSAAGLPELSERIMNPISCVKAGVQKGILSEKSLSFIEADTAMRLLTLKPADDTRGIIARFYGKDEPVDRISVMGKPLSIIRNTVDERPYEGAKGDGFITYRLGADEVRLKIKEEALPKTDEKKPLPIGEFYTGLITEPKAACGENDGHLYLLWGASRETNLSHYKLFRGESADFVPDASTHIADVLPEEYVVGRYVDTGLETHTEYFYRVCAVNTDGVCGELSKVFSALTKEPINKNTY